MKTLLEMKATLLDDDAFRLLALPYGGPIPFPGAPRGADLDRQWFSERTDFGKSGTVDVTWHHGLDETMGPEVVGKAGDLEFDDDGGWVKVWLDHGRRRTRLIKMLAEAAKDDDEVGIYGSSEAVPGSGLLQKGSVTQPWRPKSPGEIVRWHYSGQTLSTSPQNTNSILVPVKATLEDLSSGDLAADPTFFDDLARWLDDLVSSPAASLPVADPATRGDKAAKAGRVLASRNEARLREAQRLLDAPFDASLRADAKRLEEAKRAIAKVLDELEDRFIPVEL